ncbi:MAG: hypothetical protein QOH21_722 [Acidobacteriota bacterium]|jgi:hypothetical protein|nr:hypothetical protein [Acidobacteriota bacterium]
MALWNLFFSSVLLPLIGIALLGRRRGVPRAGWVATLILAGGLTAFSFFAAPWGLLGVPLRWALALLFVIATVVSIRRPADPEAGQESPFRMIGKIAIGLFFGSVGAGALAARSVEGPTIELTMPLRGGTFLVAHGGSTPAANVYAGHPTQGLAVDFTKLNAAGLRARGFAPSALEKYAVYGSAVVSPCAGTVIVAIDGLADNVPPARDEKSAGGNQVVLRCGDAEVHLEHLQRGSVAVKAGAAVGRGAPLGRAGNSGNSTEPHLHIYATRGNHALGMTFDGRWLVRNATVRRELLPG